jgi:hypothetical protein
LLRKEVHAVPLWEALSETSVELSSRERNVDTSSKMEGNHAIEEQVILTLCYDL